MLAQLEPREDTAPSSERVTLPNLEPKRETSPTSYQSFDPREPIAPIVDDGVRVKKMGGAGGAEVSRPMRGQR